MNSTPNTSTEIFKDLRQTATDKLNSAALSEKFDKGSEIVEQKVKEYANVATDYIKQNPAYAILGAAGIGLVLGVFLARKVA